MARISDVKTWLLGERRIYRYLIYRKVFTPYEQQEAFVDESFYEDDTYQLGVVEEAIDLGCGDWLLGIRNIDEEGWLDSMVVYVRLSDIRLHYFKDDQSVLRKEQQK